MIFKNRPLSYLPTLNSVVFSFYLLFAYRTYTSPIFQFFPLSLIICILCFPLLYYFIVPNKLRKLLFAVFFVTEILHRFIISIILVHAM
jgi:hypothetical protein